MVFGMYLGADLGVNSRFGATLGAITYLILSDKYIPQLFDIVINICFFLIIYFFHSQPNADYVAAGINIS